MTSAHMTSDDEPVMHVDATPVIQGVYDRITVAERRIISVIWSVGSLIVTSVLAVLDVHWFLRVGLLVFMLGMSAFYFWLADGPRRQQ